MDPFDDVFQEAPIARARAGGKFIPKAKSKRLPQHVASTSLVTEGNFPNECSNAVDSTLGTSAKEFLKSSHHSSVEIPNLDNTTNFEMGNFQQVNVNRDDAVSVDALPSTIAASEANGDWSSTNFPKSANEADPVGFDLGLVTDIVPGTNLNNASSNTIGTEPSKYWEGPFLGGNKSLEPIDTSLQVYQDLGSKSASDSKVTMSEKNIHSNSNFERAGEVESAEFELDPFSNILPDPGARNARKFQPKIKPRPRVGTAAAVASASPNVMMGKSVELLSSCADKVQFFESSGGSRGLLNQSTNASLPTSEILRATDTSNNFDYTCSSIPFSEGKRSLGEVIPSQPNSPNAMLSEVAVHNGARDWASGFGKSSGETADIFSGLENLDDFLTQAAAATGKPALHSFHEKGTEENFVIPACSSVNSSIFGVCDTAQVQKCPDYNTTQDSFTFKEDAVFNEGDTHTNNGRLGTEEVVGSNPSCPLDDALDYSSMKSVPDATFEIPVHEELTNVADSPTFGDFLNVEDVPVEKVGASGKEKDARMSSSPRNHEKSSVAGEEDKVGKTSRQLRKRATRKPVDQTENEVVEEEDDLDPTYNSNRDELEEHDDEYGWDDSSKKKRASTSSKKKSVAKNGKPPQKRNRPNEDLDRSTKEPPKKFSHSTRRRKRCVDKTLLETPEDELDPQTLRIRDIILLAEYRERLAKKEATTSKTSSVNPSDGGSLHGATTHNEEILGSEDGRGSDDDLASEGVPLASSLFNYQSFMDKAPRGKWSKQDTELFYEAVQQFGTDFSMIQQLFPGRTRHQVKLKYKKEERQHPLQLFDAVNNHGKDHSHFKSVIERLHQASAKAEQDPVRDAPDGMMGEEVVNLTPETNEEEVAKSEQDAAVVQDQENNGSFQSPEKSEESDDDLQRWCQYKSDY